MKKPIVSFILSFFLLGLGHVYNGRRKMVGVLLTIGAVIATYVELQLKSAAPALYPYSLVSFLLLGAALGGDAYREAKSINGR